MVTRRFWKIKLNTQTSNMHVFKHGFLFLLILAGVYSCGIYREVVKEELPVVLGLEGLKIRCAPSDTVESVLIKNAEAIFDTGEQRYETQLTVYAVKDSMMYFSAVNNGFEVLRGAIEKDSIRIIDRLNKIVYLTPVKRRFGFHHPVDFEDIQNLVHGYFLCDDLDKAEDVDFFHIRFDFDDAMVRKNIFYDRESLKLDKFEYYHVRTDKYLMGERQEDGFQIYSNFIINNLKVFTRGGEVSFNEHIRVKMDYNKRRYTRVDM